MPPRIVVVFLSLFPPCALPTEWAQTLSIRQWLRRLLNSVGIDIVRLEEINALTRRYERLTQQLHAALLELHFGDLPDTPGRVAYLARLAGTDVPEGIHLLAALHRSLANGGDICEFGVAQGATSALIANELAHHARKGVLLWLYDSFEGLPPPTKEDELIDDIMNLGDIGLYAGKMAVPLMHVTARLQEIEGWPKQNTRIVPGFFGAATAADALPERVAFAYVDFDFYRPILDVLTALHDRLVPGSTVMVDDYGHFSSGAQRAVDEFYEHHMEAYTFECGPSYSPAFALLTFRG